MDYGTAKLARDNHMQRFRKMHGFRRGCAGPSAATA
jgi:hypothetical protein